VLNEDWAISDSFLCLNFADRTAEADWKAPLARDKVSRAYDFPNSLPPSPHLPSTHLNCSCLFSFLFRPSPFSSWPQSCVCFGSCCARPPSHHARQPGPEASNGALMGLGLIWLGDPDSCDSPRLHALSLSLKPDPVGVSPNDSVAFPLIFSALSVCAVFIFTSPSHPLRVCGGCFTFLLLCVCVCS
jgi:hypothetical protein